MGIRHIHISYINVVIQIRISFWRWFYGTEDVLLSIHRYALQKFTMHTLSSNLIYPSDLIKPNITFPNVHTHIYVYMAISLQNTFSLYTFCDGHSRRPNKETWVLKGFKVQSYNTKKALCLTCILKISCFDLNFSKIYC